MTKKSCKKTPARTVLIYGEEVMDGMDEMDGMDKMDKMDKTDEIDL